MTHHRTDERRLYRTTGFTLIEILLVIAIIAVLAVIAIPQFISYRSQAVDTPLKSDLRNAAVAVESYFTKRSVYPSSIDDIQGFGFQPTSGVTLTLVLVTQNSYTITAAKAGGTQPSFTFSIEDPSRVILMIEWDSVEAHTQQRERNDSLNCTWKEHSTMIHEIVIQHVEPQKREEYIQVFGDILKEADYAGAHGIQFFTSIEDPSRVILMIEWDSVEAHTQHRGTPTHNAMREVTSRYQTQKSDGGHFNLHRVTN